MINSINISTLIVLSDFSKHIPPSEYSAESTNDIVRSEDIELAMKIDEL